MGGYDKLVHMKFNFCAVTAFLFLALAAGAQTTAFTYQGQLNSNNVPVTGAFDLRFKIYDANNSVVGKWLTNAPVGVTNGLFIVTLDFGPGVFDGSLRTLEIGVRTNGNTNAYIVLSPRQTLTSVPYAIQAINASNAVALTAPLQATNLAGTIPNSLLSPNVAILTNNVIFSGSVTAANFIGNGSGLAVPATSLTGTLPDARLSANVALYNANASFSNGVTAVVFTGSGRWLTNVPGAFFWVTNAGTSYQIQSNMGYIATNDTAPVIFTLPLSPIAGDVYKVAGVGAGGWMIMQNANQMIAAGNLSKAIGQSWKAGASVLNWSAIASSAYGTKLVATVGYTTYYTSGSGQIYTSTDSGATWTARAGSLGSLPWSSVASSADGTKLVAMVYGTSGSSGIYTSTDSGGSWTFQGMASYCSAVASSADGTNLVATFSSGANQGIYTSTSSGASGSWQQRTNIGGCTAVASSVDGSRLVVTTSGGQIYISTDSGATWVAQISTVSGQITSVACSSDSSQLAITIGGSSGNIFASSDSGATWRQLAGAPTGSWAAIAASADGSQLAAAVYGGKIYVSSQSSTTTGTAGYLIGSQHSAIELIYAGNNLFLPLSHEGTIRAY